MRYAATIGKNWANTLSEVDKPGTEWYIPPASSIMTLQELKAWQQKLLDQNIMWLNTMNGANAASITNIGKIMDIQNAKLERYEAMIIEKEAANTPPVYDPVTGTVITPGPADTPPVLKKNNWLLIGGIALTALLIFRR